MQYKLKFYRYICPFTQEFHLRNLLQGDVSSVKDGVRIFIVALTTNMRRKKKQTSKTQKKLGTI